MLDAPGENGVRSEECIGGVHTSLFDLEVRDILLEGGANNAFNKSIIDLTNPQIELGSVVEVFLTLSSPEFNALSFFGPGQDFILQIGGNEYSIQVDENGEQRFTELDTDYYVNLTADDFLAISIFLNSDAANVLWQLEFTTMDIDIDSDNNNGFGLPDRNFAEEAIEADRDKPGKVYTVNDGDVNGNQVPDFAEFDYSGASNNFVPFVVEIPSQIDLSSATVMFVYSGSDPQKIKIEEVGTDEYPSTRYTPDSGSQRIWLKNANEVRNPQTDYMASGTKYSANVLGFTDSERIKVFYLEGVRETDMGEASIQVSLEYED